MSARLLIREAHLYELEDIRQFYKENHDPHVMLRTDADVKNAIDEGVFFLALDVDQTDGSRIVGASAVYTVEVPDDQGKPVVLKESGGSLVASTYRGYGLHKLFHSARALHKYLLDYRGFDHYFGAIICPNPNSEKNIVKAGFEAWADPPASLVSSRAGYADADQTIKFFRLPIEALSQHAKNLLEFEETGSVTHSKTGEIAKLDMPIQLLRLYRVIVAKMANGDPKTVLES